VTLKYFVQKIRNGNYHQNIQQFLFRLKFPLVGNPLKVERINPSENFRDILFEYTHRKVIDQLFCV